VRRRDKALPVVASSIGGMFLERFLATLAATVAYRSRCYYCHPHERSVCRLRAPAYELVPCRADNPLTIIAVAALSLTSRQGFRSSYLLDILNLPVAHPYILLKIVSIGGFRWREHAIKRCQDGVRKAQLSSLGCEIRKKKNEEGKKVGKSAKAFM